MAVFLSIGTGPGIGLATAERFAREGFHLVLSARDTGRVTALAAELQAKGHKAEVRGVDVADPAAVAALVAGVERDLGPIDVLHYNAAAIRQATLADQPAETFNADLAVSIGGALAAAKAVTPAMAARGRGTLLLTGGGFALAPHPDYLTLSVGKAGLRALAQGLFEEMTGKGIHVATVTVAGFVSAGSPHVANIAEHFWQLHAQPAGSWTLERTYTP
ncbi:SDR family NAD(P)-dependent oxidoreductase [Ancylobacter sonchi]|uniref:SDR family NAD(P)-dependent oxidoreductase n=1 Tax=Ancylobacter sonchi TaxID=1937790 RepID=UPI001BD66B9C|nr:SDR family NAD(P)-dependent oxidoreductase [Ancylobacter sonchi]MBS7534099.1 SDR family NAD(P)-dependent oxidoreductase [Ancylobacter sonchi]